MEWWNDALMEIHKRVTNYEKKRNQGDWNDTLIVGESNIEFGKGLE